MVVLLVKIRPSPLKEEIYVRLTTRGRHLNLSIIQDFLSELCDVRIKYDVRHNPSLRSLFETVEEAQVHSKAFLISLFSQPSQELEREICMRP